MNLTRREFAAATAGGLSLFSFVATADRPRADRVRHAHAELPAGPYPREVLARIVAQAGGVLGLSAPESATVLGAALHDVTFPAEFALTLVYPEGLGMVIRASRAHTGAPELTVRGDRGRIDYRFEDGVWVLLL